ncbi:MAG: LTA synthase family protein [Castellaniella sp.]
MRTQTLYFVLAGLALLSFSRLTLMAWQWRRVRQARGWWPILIGGLRIDAALIAMFAGLPALLGPWLGHLPLATAISGIWFLLVWMLVVIPEVSTPGFIAEYDTRPDRLYVEYLGHPREVFGMLWKAYRTALLGAAVLIAVFFWLGLALFPRLPADAPLSLAARVGLTLVLAPLVFLAIRGTVAHRPMNPSTVAFCGDGLLNALALNSLYSVLYSVYSTKNERSATRFYGSLDEDRVNAVVNACAGITGREDGLPSLHVHSPSHHPARPLNLVIIVEESLGARYVASLGGQGLTPCLDALAGQGWYFTRAYATGTRSVRGLEALVAGFPPSVSDAALRLPGAQSGFFTLAQLLRTQGYRSQFIYGGEAHFDNMKGFLLGNGFDELHDIHSFEQPAFVGTWGASDEDMFERLHVLMSTPSEQPGFVLAFTVSNHSPWEYPEGRIAVAGDPATVENSVRYADWALGRFFDRARASAYWDNTLFLVVADHDAQASGTHVVPMAHFHIPALVLGGPVAPRRDDRIISQIDLPVTLLSLMGIPGPHPMIGHDLTTWTGGRAMMQYKMTYAYLKEDELLVLQPQRDPLQFHYRAPEGYDACVVNPVLHEEALAHALWPGQIYRQRAYTLPGLKRPGGPNFTPLPEAASFPGPHAP